MISGVTEDQLRNVLRKTLSPSRAISNPEYLRGRQKLLSQMSWAFNSPGKHAFVYGERGVGKTSLAQSAAFLEQSSESDPIRIACDEFVDFNKMVGDMVRRALPPEDVVERRTKQSKGGLNFRGISGEIVQGLSKGVIPPAESLNDAVMLLDYVGRIHSKSPVIIVDEFDQISNREDRKRFADLIKQVSDQEINVRFIFCGIGRSLEELIGVHFSTDRYLAPIEVQPLNHDALWEILRGAASELGVTISDEEYKRVSMISSGFPYYVHLIGEHLLRAVFYDEMNNSSVSLDNFHEGMKGAISEAMGSLRMAYELAVQKYTDDYEEVLWSVADSITLSARPTSEIYEKSYLPIVSERNRLLASKGLEERNVLPQKTFYQRMNNLKQKGHGEILVGTRQGWYQFRENWMRGYVRLVAERNGVSLGVDHHFAPAPDFKSRR